jgi:hypothetical protein
MSQMFFFDEQIRRYLLQFTRMFSLFEVEYGRDEQGIKDLVRVPIRYGDAVVKHKQLYNRTLPTRCHPLP